MNRNKSVLDIFLLFPFPLHLPLSNLMSAAIAFNRENTNKCFFFLYVYVCMSTKAM